jgi:hypothetical protein
MLLQYKYFLHTNAIADKRFHTQTLLQIHYFTHRRRFYTRTILHTDTFTYKSF